MNWNKIRWGICIIMAIVEVSLGKNPDTWLVGMFIIGTIMETQKD